MVMGWVMVMGWGLAPVGWGWGWGWEAVGWGWVMGWVKGRERAKDLGMVMVKCVVTVMVTG
jgi:hypothetical protein